MKTICKIVFQPNRFGREDVTSLYKLMDCCTRQVEVDEGLINEVKSLGRTGFEVNPIKRDVINFDGLEELNHSRIKGFSIYLFSIIIDAKKCKNPADMMPLLLLQREYMGRVAIGIDLDGYDIKEQTPIIFKYSDFLLFIKDNATNWCYHSLYLINEKKKIQVGNSCDEKEGDYVYVSDTRVSSLRYKSILSNKTIEEAISKASRYYQPLFHINRTLFNRLFQNAPSGESPEVSYIEQSVNKLSANLNGIITLNYPYSSLFEKWFFLAYYWSLPALELKEIDVDGMNATLHDYYIGVYELVQNIIFHNTTEKIGWLYVMFCKYENLSFDDFDHLRKCGYNDNAERYLKVGVYDFGEQGIVDTFCANNKLSGVDLSMMIDPNKMPETCNLDEEKVDPMMLTYAAHLGIKMLVSSVIFHQGWFRVESCQNGEKYSINGSSSAISDVNKTFNVNGTHYDLLLPVAVFNRGGVYPMQSSSVSGFLKEQLNHPTEVEAINISECLDVARQTEVTSLFGQWNFIEEVANNIIKRYKKEKMTSSDGICAINMDGNSFANSNQLLKLLAHIQLSIQAVDTLVLANLTEVNIAHIIRAVNQAAQVRSSKQQPLWSRDHVVVLYGNSVGACVLCGETLHELEYNNYCLNQIYPGYKNILLHSSGKTVFDEGQVQSMKRWTKPYECIVKVDGVPLFLHQVQKELDRPIGSYSGGYLVKDFFTKLGSKLYMNYFFEADTMFQNGFFIDRFAFFIAKDITVRRKELDDETKKKPIVILGYLSYSEPLSRRVQYYVNQCFPNAVSQVVTAIETEGTNDMAFHWQNVQNDTITQFDDTFIYILIVPISSTLSSNDKTISYFKKNTGHESIIFPFQYSALLIRDRESENSTTSIEKEWGISAITDKDVFATYEDTKQVRYLIRKQSYWHNLVDDKTFPQCYKDEIFLNRTKNASLNITDYFGFPIAALPSRGEMYQELSYRYGVKDFTNIAQGYYRLTKERLMEFGANIQIGHIEHHGNHHRYYFNTEDYVGSDGNVEFEKWLDFQKKRLSDDDALIGPCVIISTDVNKESCLVDCINERIFEGRALVVHIDVFSSAQNISFKYSFLKQLSPNSRFFFVDHAMLTGGTFNKTRLLLSFANNNTPFVFDGVFAVVNRLSYNLYNQIKNEIGKYGVASYIWFSVLPSQNTYADCSLCGLERRYYNLGRCTVSRDGKIVCEKNKQKFVLSKLRYYNSQETDINKPSFTAKDRRKMSRMIARYKLFYNISLLLEDEKGDVFNTVDQSSEVSNNKVLEYLNNEYVRVKDNIDEKISFLKAVTFPPLSQYVHVRKFAFETSLKELSVILEKNKNSVDYSDFCLLKAILKHLSYLSSNALVRKDVIVNAWRLCFNVLHKTELAISELNREAIPDLFQPPYQDQRQRLVLQKRELEFFKSNFLFYIKNAIHNDEAKSFFLGELLRTGDEPEVSLPLEMHTSDEAAFAKEIKSSFVFAEFLDSLYYDNNAILRKTLSNFENEIKKKATGLGQYFWTEKNILLPFEVFERNVNSVVELLLEIVNGNYYYTWFRLFVSEDSVSKGHIIDKNKDGVPLVRKLVYVLYAKLLLDKVDKGGEHEFKKDVETLLKVYRKVMDASFAFISIRYKGKYKILDNCGLYEVKDDEESSYNDFMADMSMNIAKHSFLIVEKENYFSGINNACFKKGCFLPLFDKTPNHTTRLPIGCVSFLYDTDTSRFKIKNRECGRLLMLLSEELDKYITHCITEKSFELWYDQDETRRRYRKTNFTSNHRLQLGNWDFESLDPESFVKIHNGLFMMSNVVVSHLYSVIAEKGYVNFDAQTKSIRDIFSEKFIALLTKFNEERWGGTLEPVILGDVDFELKCNVVIIQSLIIQCLENASGKYADRAKKINIWFGSNGFSIHNTIVNIAQEQLIHDSKLFYMKYDENILEENIRLSHLSDYGMTLVSIKSYCESVGMMCKWEFNVDKNPFFIVEISVKK